MTNPIRTNVKLIVCIAENKEEQFFEIPLKQEVRVILKEILETTQKKISQAKEISEYEPAEKYDSSDIVSFKKGSTGYEKIKYIYEQQNFAKDCQALNHSENIIYYMGVFDKGDGKKLIGVKKANHFKSLVKSKGLLLAQFDDNLGILDTNVFKLDSDFDFIIESNKVLICNPKAFEFCAQMDEQLLEVAKKNTKDLEKKMKFISFDGLADYVSKHSRAARLIASIRLRKDLNKISEDKLKDHCLKTGVNLSEIDGKITPSKKHELNFLYVLDRRKYSYELIEDKPEIYVANSRKQVNR